MILLLLLACTGEPESPLACASTLDDNVATVIVVSCTARADGELSVRYGRDRLTDETPAQAVTAGDSVELPLYGMPASSLVAWTAQLVTDAGTETLDGAQSTGALPAELPAFDVLHDDEADGGPRFFLGAVFGGQPANFVLDRDGNYVWYRLLDPSLWTIEVRFAAGTRDILSNEFATDHGVDLGQIRRYSLRGEELATYDPVASHHVFTELGPDAGADAGTLAYLAIDVRDWYDPSVGKTIPVVGDQVVEIAPDGTQRTVFSLWDWLEVTPSNEFDIPFYTQGKDWSHGNALHWYADTDTYLLSFDNLQTAVEFRRSDGVPVRWYGPDWAPPDGYGIADGSIVWDHQHDVQRRADGHLTAFATNASTGLSGAVEYELDEAEGVMREVWSGGFDAGLRSPFLGQMEPLDNGDVMVNYGGSRQLAEYTRDGAQVWALGTETGNFFGQVHPFDDFYLR